MKPSIAENFLDELISTKPVTDNFSVSAFMASTACRLSADVCFEATKSSEYTEANKRLSRIQLQLEHYEKRFSELSGIFKSMSNEINFPGDFATSGKQEQISEIFIDFLKHAYEVISMIRSVAEFSEKYQHNEVYASANLINAATGNILFTIKSLPGKNNAGLAGNISKRSGMLSESIFNYSNQIFSLLQKEINH